MGKIKVGCKQCGKMMIAPEAAIGRKVKCSQCHVAFLIDDTVILARSSPAVKTETEAKKAPIPQKETPQGKPSVAKQVPPKIHSEPESEPAQESQPAYTKSAHGVELKDLEPLFPSSSIALALFGVLITLGIYWLTAMSVFGALLWHGVANFGMVTSGDVTKIALYVVGFLGLSGALLLVLKPVLARRSHKVTRNVKPSAEPELLSVIRHVASSIDAPVPTRLQSDYEFGLKVQPYGSWFDFSRDKIELTIGVPIMTTYKVDQFAALLTTQLAPYSTKLFSDSWLFVVRVHDWLEQTSWRPDQWDDRVNALAARTFAPLALLWNLVITLVNRLPFKVLFLIMTGLSRVPLQNQQFNADYFAYNLIGVGKFSEFLFETQNLVFAHESSTNDFIESIQSKYEVSNKFEGMIIKRKYLNEFQILDIKELVEAGKTWSFGFLSNDALRIQMAEENSVDVAQPFTDERTLKDLVKGYYHLASVCTSDMANQIAIMSVGQKAKTRTSRHKRADAINRYIKSAVREGIKSEN